MRSKFQADEDLDARIPASEAGILGKSDREVLRFAASQDRILISEDRGTMPRHLREHLTQDRSPGVFLLREAIPIGLAIEEIALIWEVSEAEEWTGRLVWIPL